MAIPNDVLEYSIPAYFYPCESNPMAKTLIIAFTSHGGCGIHFEYVTPLKQYDKAHVLFLSTCVRNGWYINGGLNDTYPDLTQVMTNIIDPILTAKSIQNVITLGEGSGGTGAIYYGWELAKKVTTSILAFSPYNSIPADNWNLAVNICDTTPVASLAHKGNFKIFIDRTYQPEVDRIGQLGGKGFDVYEIEGHQHLSKSAYARGDLFRYLDVELNADDIQDDRDYGIISSDKYASDRLVCHQEEIDNGTCNDILGNSDDDD